jgi:hypothetical protein
MVAALRAGTKTQTRRTIIPRGRNSLFDGGWTDGYVLDPGNAEWRRREIGVIPGDRFWVRESYYQRGHWAPVDGAQTKGGRQKWGFVPADDVIAFDQPAGEVRLGRHNADPGTVCWHKRLGRFMPRSASRMTLTVTDVRVQRLQDISEEDAIAEGATRIVHEGPPGCGSLDAYHHGQPSMDDAGFIDARASYRDLWDHINGAGAWAANPWVVAYSFTVERRNIDAEG